MDKGDLGAPTCNNCHGNHGAVPPAVGSVANACGICHGKIAGLFADTRMKHRFEEEKLPGCATCHDSHAIQVPSDKMVGMRGGAVCISATPTASTAPPWPAPMPPGKSARDWINSASRSPMPTRPSPRRRLLGMEVSQPKFDLRNATNCPDQRPHAAALLPGQAGRGGPGRRAEGRREGPGRRPIRPWPNTPIGGYGWPPRWCPILIVIGLLLLYIRTLPAAEIAADSL